LGGRGRDRAPGGGGGGAPCVSQVRNKEGAKPTVGETSSCYKEKRNVVGVFSMGGTSGGPEQHKNLSRKVGAAGDELLEKKVASQADEYGKLSAKKVTLRKQERYQPFPIGVAKVGIRATRRRS